MIAIEDLHWIDAASEEFLTYLTESIAASAVLVLLTHRPGYRHPFGDHSYHARVALRPLSDEEEPSRTKARSRAAVQPRSVRAALR